MQDRWALWPARTNPKRTENPGLRPRHYDSSFKRAHGRLGLSGFRLQAGASIPANCFKFQCRLPNVVRSALSATAG